MLAALDRRAWLCLARAVAAYFVGTLRYELESHRQAVGLRERRAAERV
jgi:hypothetical protein